MNREEAIDRLKGLFGNGYSKQEEALNMAIKALEQEPILDKIRAEIEQGYCEVEDDYDRGRNMGLYIAMQIIDKYKAESEG